MGGSSSKSPSSSSTWWDKYVSKKQHKEQMEHLQSLTKKLQEDLTRLQRERDDRTRKYREEIEKMRKDSEKQQQSFEKKNEQLLIQHQEKMAKERHRLALKPFVTHPRGESMLRALIFEVKYGSDETKINEITALTNQNLHSLLEGIAAQELESFHFKMDILLKNWDFPIPPNNKFEGRNEASFNIGIAGASGSGKSSLVRALLIAEKVDKAIIKSVRVDIDECTMEATGYQIRPRVILWDLPGGGTVKFPAGKNGEEYIRNQYLTHFDLVLIVSSTRIRKIEVDAFNMLRKLHKNVAWVRTKVDIDVENSCKDAMWGESDDEEEEEDYEEKVLRSCMSKIFEEIGDQPQHSLFLIGQEVDRKRRKIKMIYDFENLRDRIALSGLKKLDPEAYEKIRIQQQIEIQIKPLKQQVASLEQEYAKPHTINKILVAAHRISSDEEEEEEVKSR